MVEARKQRRHPVRPFGSTGLVALLALVFVWTAPPARASLACHAEVDRTQVYSGDQLTLEVTVEGDAGWSADYKLPDIPDVSIYEGGTSQSMIYSGGQTVTTLIRTYFLQVDARKDFTVGPVEIRTKGDVCRTDPIKIQVLDPAKRPQAAPPTNTPSTSQAPTASPRTGSRGQVRSPSGQPGDEVFVTLAVDRQEAWVGQQVILTFSYYRRVQPWNNPSYTAPRTEGFWRESLGPERDFRSVVSGQVYNVTEIRYALFPTQAGELTIEPAELAFREDVFDRFFNSRRRAGPRVYRTEPVTVTVKPLPQPAPAAFSGLVATRLDLEMTTAETEVPRGEPLGLSLRLVADGFLKGFTGLELPEPEAARVHEAGENFKTGIEQDRLISEITVDKVLVPRQEGSLAIPVLELSWFDAGRGRYRTSRATVDPVAVLPSDLPVEGDESSGFLRNEIARLGNDLAFIHQPGASLRRGARLPVGAPLWWVLALAPLVLLGIWHLYLGRLAALQRDPAGLRRRAALGVARRRLKEALAATDPVASFDTLARAIMGYAAAVTDRPEASMTAGDVRTLCGRLGREDLGQLLAEALHESDNARFGGGQASRSAKDLAGRIETALGQLSAELNRRGRRGGLPRLRSTELRSWLWWPILAGLVGLSLAAGPTVAAVRSGGDPMRWLAEGNQDYTAGDLDQALAAYQQALDAGVDDAVLHFNLGNVHARRGELGRAVASYLRARRLAPRDGDIKANLDWVRSHIRDLELNDSELPLFIAQLYALEESLTLGEWGAVLIVAVWLLAGLLAWGRFRGIGPGLRRGLLFGAGVLVVIASVTSWRYYREDVRRQAVVVAPEVAVLSGPDETFSTLFQVHDGLTVYVEDRQDGWARIGMGGEWQGWVPQRDLEMVAASPAAMEKADAQPSGR